MKIVSPLAILAAVLMMIPSLTTLGTQAFTMPPTRTFRSALLVAAATTTSRTTARAASTTTTCAAEPLQKTSESYQKLLTKLQSITHLQRVQAVLGYDQLVFMPQAASAERGNQLSALAGLIHEQTTNPELKDLIGQALRDVDTAGSEDTDAKRLLELEQKAYEENERISADLAAKAASLGSTAYTAWTTARENDDFDAFAPVLEECFETAMELSKAKRGNAERDLYSQMLDEYEVGMPQDRIDEIFGEIQEALVPLIQRVLESSYQPSTDPLMGDFNVDAQKELGTDIVTKLGFDINLGRIDVSVHPFTNSFSPKDVRITSRYRTDEWYQGLAAMIHEGGHAMYEQNLGDSATRLDTALSMGTHESQSLFWERHIGLSESFWEWALPQWKEKFPDEFKKTTARQVYEAVNNVSPSLIRVEADELTYPLHVILRYRIEREVIEGKLPVKDIAQRWKDDMKTLLNVNVPTDREGCLQDVHWSALAFGYFPTYLIGSASAAQLCHFCKQDLPNMDELVQKGEFGPIKEWVVEKVHKHGKRYESLDALFEAQLGEKLNPKYFIEYLTDKYSDIYKL